MSFAHPVDIDQQNQGSCLHKSSPSTLPSPASDSSPCVIVQASSLAMLSSTRLVPFKSLRQILGVLNNKVSSSSLYHCDHFVLLDQVSSLNLRVLHMIITVPGHRLPDNSVCCSGISNGLCSTHRVVSQFISISYSLPNRRCSAKS